MNLNEKNIDESKLEELIYTMCHYSSIDNYLIADMCGISIERFNELKASAEKKVNRDTY